MKRFLLALSLLSLLALPSVASAQTQWNWDFSTSGSGQMAGASLVDMSDQLRTFFGVPAGTGVLVDNVQPGSSAESAGLVSGDVVVSIAGQPVASTSQVFQLTASLNGAVNVGTYRYGEPYEVSVTMAGAGAPNAMMYGLDPAMIEQMMGSFDPAMLEGMMQ